MAATASIVIEVQDVQANAAMQRLNTQAAAIGQTFQPVQRISEQTFNNIEGGALKARESAALLGEEFGVKVPRALRGVIAESSLLGPVFTAAFSGLAVLGFIEIVKQAVEQLTGFGEALKAIEKQNAELMQSIGAANKVLIGPQTLQEVNSRILETTKTIASLNENLGMTGSLYGDALTRGLAKYNMQHQLEVEELDKKKALLNDLYGEQAKLRDEELRTEPIEILKLKNQTLLAGLVGLARIEAAEKEGVNEAIRNAKAVAENEAVTQAKIVMIRAEAEVKKIAFMNSEEDASRHLAQEAQLTYSKGEDEIIARARIAVEEQQVLRDRNLKNVGEDADARYFIEHYYQERVVAIGIIADSKRVELRRQALEETTKMEEDAAVAMLPPWQRSYAQIAVDTQNRLREIQRAFDETKISGGEAARQIAATWQMNFAKMRDQLAGDLENLFDNITSGNIGKFFLQQFKHLVFQMVASWILGMQQMKGASQQTMNGGGGILGAIFGSLGLGGIFGGGSGGGSGGGQGGISSLPGVITNFGGGNFASGDTGGALGMLPTALSGGALATMGGLVPGMGLSAGVAGGTAGMTLPTGAGPAGGIIGGLGGALGPLLAKAFPHGLSIGGKTVSGAALAAVGIALVSDSFRKGGFLRGLEGAAGGAMTGFAIGGPIGAIIGGIAGFILGIWGKSTKAARLAIEANIKTQAATIEDSYNLFQTDWTTSRTALEALRQQGVDALKQAGVKDISRSRVGHVDQWIDKAEKEIDLTQAERNRRNALTFGPAQFRVGGFVGAGAGGAIPSWFAGTAMHFAGGGAVPAILHEGEFVMRPEAVNQIGRGNLDRMNSGGSGGDTHVHFHIDAVDAKSVRELLSDSSIQREFHKMYVRGVNEGQW